MGTRIGLLVFVFSSNVQHDLVACFVLVRDACSIFPFIVLCNQFLLVLPYDFPIGGMLDIEDHISAENQLARGTT
jgi:hypothetical protein